MRATTARATDAEVVAELERRGPEDLVRFVPHVTPSFVAPRHLAPLARVLEASLYRPQRVVVSVPPRHAKTDTLLHALSWLLLRRPSMQIAYLSYAEKFAARKCRRARRIAERAGVLLGDKAAEDEWDTTEGGLVRSTGVLGQLTGDGFHLIVVDDAHKNREEAESPTMREKIWEAWQDDISTRVEPGGASMLVVGARWHVEDLPGRLVDRGWRYINLQAIDDATGAPLWPEVWPLDALEAIRSDRTDYSWRSLYQGSPVPRGGALFGPATYCERREVPRSGIVGAFGCDLAYSGKTHSDFSAVVVVVKDRASGTLYVADVLRVQRQAAQFAALARERVAAWPGVAGRWYTSTTERGTAELLGELGLRVRPVLATGDKFVRAQPVAAAWQAGRIRVPRDMPWTEEFVREVTGFTGLGDRHDDQVDALAAAFDEIEQGYSVVKLVRAAKGL